MTTAGSISTFTIKSNGAPIDSTIQVISIDTHAAFGDPASARIAVFDGSPSSGDFPISDSPTFAPGAAIEVLAGYDGVEQPIFEGFVTTQAIEIDSSSASRLIIDVEAAEAIDPPAEMPAPVLTLTYGDNILELEAQTVPEAGDESAGEVLFQGSALAVPGAAITLAGLGSRFSGTALITEARQTIAEGNWTTIATYAPPGAV